MTSSIAFIEGYVKGAVEKFASGLTMENRLALMDKAIDMGVEALARGRKTTRAARMAGYVVIRGARTAKAG